MKKITALLLICVCLAVFSVGCKNKNSSPLNDLKPMIMIDGKLYLDTGKEATASESSETVSGEILSTVPQTEKPTENGQSNFGAVGNPYYIDGGDLIVQINDKWFKFEQDSTN